MSLFRNLQSTRIFFFFRFFSFKVQIGNSMLCACLLYLFSSCPIHVHDLVERYVIADDPYDEMRQGPWGERPEDPKDWNIDWENFR